MIIDLIIIFIRDKPREKNISGEKIIKLPNKLTKIYNNSLCIINIIENDNFLNMFFSNNNYLPWKKNSKLCDLRTSNGKPSNAVVQICLHVSINILFNSLKFTSIIIWVNYPFIRIDLFELFEFIFLERTYIFWRLIYNVQLYGFITGMNTTNQSWF